MHLLLTAFLGPWTTGPANGVAFPSLASVSDKVQQIIGMTKRQDPLDYLPQYLDPTLIAGFKEQVKSLVDRLGTNATAAYEIINNNAGSLTISIMHPLSRGTCHIASAKPFDQPSIDPRWLSNPTDRQIMIEALKFNREILASPYMVDLRAAQFVPPRNAGEDALNQIINNGIRTEFHPSSTLSMLPLELGGVVDGRLLVYGTKNLRVVDASVFPMTPAAHLQAAVYAVAEKVCGSLLSKGLERLIRPGRRHNQAGQGCALCNSRPSDICFVSDADGNR